MVHGFIIQSKGHIEHPERAWPRHHRHASTCRAPPTWPAAATSAVAAVALPRGHEEILVVEDEPRVRAAMVEQLQSLGYAVTQAADGSAGIAAFERASGPTICC